MRSNLKESGMLVDNRELEVSLVDFCQRVSIKTQKNPAMMIDEILTRLKDMKEQHERNKFDRVQENTDFFISYSRRDSIYAEKLYNALTEKGYNVWYDKKDIAIGIEWETQIRRGIRTSKKFIALLSENIALESKDHHPYRTEWDIALAHRMNDPSFVIPLCIGTLDIYKNLDLMLPDDLIHINSEQWSDVENVASVSDKLISLMR
jgi:hypothetical protein